MLGSQNTGFVQPKRVNETEARCQIGGVVVRSSTVKRREEVVFWGSHGHSPRSDEN